MHHRVVFAILWLAFHTTAVFGIDDAASAGAKAPQTKDYWYVLRLQEKPAGYLHVRTRPQKGGGWVSTVTQKLALKRAGTAVEVRTKSIVKEDASGRIVSFRLRQKQSNVIMETVGVRKGEVFEVTDNERPRSQPLRIPADAIGPQKGEELIRERLKKEGDVVEFTLFAVEVGRATRQRTVAGPVEEIEVGGVRQRLRRLSTTQDIIPGVVIQQWVDEDYVPWKISMPILGLKFVFHRTTREAALAQSLEAPPEIFLSTAVPADKPVAGDAESVRYRILGEGSVRELAKRSAEAAGHTWKVTGERTALLQVRRVRPKEPVSLPVTASKELAPYLSASHYLQSDDAGIQRVAAEVTGSERNSWKAARKLARWVHTNVKSKNLTVVFATASEVLERREGDCSEHALLTAALCRAAGIPARVTCGLLYYDRKFVGHMWTEVFAGEWVPLDATRKNLEVGPDHIGLGVSSANDNDLMDLLVGLVQVLGRMKIEVLEVKR